MHPDNVKELLIARLENATEIQVQGDGHKYEVTVVSADFEGMNPVKKQQLVYGALNEEIASGAIHAVTIKTHTPAQWQSLNA
jgi:acid stress-induced BolA-like protein IbaG/YrbA